MATPFTDIYPIFLKLIEDYELASMIEDDFNSNLRFYLNDACTIHFIECNQDLTDVDELTGSFNVDLTSLEKYIIAHAMLLPWMASRINTLVNIRLKMTTQDFKASSAQAHLNTLIMYKRDVIRDLRDFIMRYEYLAFEGF